MEQWGFCKSCYKDAGRSSTGCFLASLAFQDLANHLVGEVGQIAVSSNDRMQRALRSDIVLYGVH